MPTPLANFVFPLTLEFFNWLTALGLFLAIGLPIMWLGMRSLNGLGRVRKWTAIIIRLQVLWLFLLILGGARWQRVHKDLDVIVLRDVSQSTDLVHDYPNADKSSLTDQIDQYLRNVSDEKLGHKPADDRIGVISFQDNALIDAMPNPKLMLDSRAIRKQGSGTDPAAAIQLGLATMRKDAMHRMLLIWDGNKTQGDLDAAAAAAAAQHVPIDVMPLNYNVTNEVLVQSFSAPTMKNEKEPFALTLVLQSTNTHPVTGTVSVYRQERVFETRKVTLNPGPNPIRIRVPGLTEGGIHQFRATFEVDAPAAVAGKPGQAGDTLSQNNSATAFTYVKGKGQTLFVDNAPDDTGGQLLQALKAEGIEIEEKNHIKAANFPGSLIQLQSYDVVILANVSAGAGGLSDDQFKMIYSYVHDMGGGLLCIGGPETYGAGGWQGKKIEEVLPVAMEIPAQRQIAKGALALIFHSIEFADGNYWGEQCGIKAAEALSERDEIGVISYGWNPNKQQSLNGAVWDFPLKDKGDGTAVAAAIKSMQQGDMPDFDDTMNLALNGLNGQGGLAHSNARQKHLIIISDGDPSPPKQALIDAYNKAQVTVSTVSVYPHMGDPDGLPPNMKDIAKQLHGKAYGPINNNPQQLPQIFIKEASIVRRSLIQESLSPNPAFKVTIRESPNDFMKGIANSISTVTRGLVLTHRKDSPQIDVPMDMGGVNKDPILAYWQAGLGRTICYMSDAVPRWNVDLVASPGYSKFWAQLVRAVARPPMSSDFTVQTAQEGGRGKVMIEAINRDNAFLNFLNFGGKILGPDGNPVEVKIVQTGPGTYEGEFAAKDPGNYVVALRYNGQKGEQGTLTSGVAVNQSPELRDLTSNEGALRQIADRTGGRVLPAYDFAAADLFTRTGITPSNSPLPIWDILIPILLGMILLDVASRRIAWDWASIQRMIATAKGTVESYTAVRKVENTQTLDALKNTRTQVGEEKFKAMAEGKSTPTSPSDRPDPTRKFEAKGVEGDISIVVGGATDKPLPSAPKKIEPKGNQPGKGDTMGGLMEAKRRAQQKIKDQEEGRK